MPKSESDGESIHAFAPASPVIAPEETLSISAQLYRQLRNAVIRGELRPGQALSESEIAQRYAISRQPVREAFIKLAEERLVVILPQRGTFVMKVSPAEILDAQFVRETIEVAISQKAAFSTSAATIRELRTLIAQQKTVAHGQNDEFFALDEAFHRTIAISVGHAHAWRIIEGSKAQMDRIRFLSLDDATPLDLLIVQHSRIVDGIESGDPTAAAAAMRSHLREIIVSLPTIAARFPELFEAAQA